LADFEALLRDQYTISRTPVENALYLLNDVYLTNAKVNTPSLSQANYMWDESADRIMLNNADEGTYYVLYGAISSCNLIIANAPTATEATDAERKEVMAYAKVIRALCYDVLVNYYADTYDKATAAEKRSVPLITSADIDAPYTQVSIQEMYDFIIQDTKEAIEMGIPAQSMTAIHPNLGAAYALLARVYLQMQNYDEALRYANLALEQNNQLFDWNSHLNGFFRILYDKIIHFLNRNLRIRSINIRTGNKRYTTLLCCRSLVIRIGIIINQHIVTKCTYYFCICHHFLSLCICGFCSCRCICDNQITTGNSSIKYIISPLIRIIQHNTVS
jgi:tetratricopeptide (TPR) repeat protein